MKVIHWAPVHPLKDLERDLSGRLNFDFPARPYCGDRGRSTPFLNKSNCEMCLNSARAAGHLKRLYELR